MKHLVCSLSIILSVLTSGSSIAMNIPTNSEASKEIDKASVVIASETANFELFSLALAKAAIDDSVEQMLATISDQVETPEAKTAGIETNDASAI